MAYIATIQVLIEDQDDDEVLGRLQTLAATLLASDGVADVRITDSAGPMVHWSTMEVGANVINGSYLTGEAFTSPHFELPTDRRVQLKSLATGTLTVDVPTPWATAHADRILIDAEVTPDGVNVTLRPPNVEFTSIGNAATASMTFVRAKELRDLIPCSPVGEGDDLAFTPGRYKVVDAITGRPPLGLMMTIAGAGKFNYVTVVDGHTVHHGLEIFETFEDQCAPMQTYSADSNAPVAMYLSEEGEVISAGRTKLVPL